MVDIDEARLAASTSIDPDRKRELGQFLTPSRTAAFMAGLFRSGNGPLLRLLDAGAGIGSLCGAFLDRWAAGEFSAARVEVTAYEIDDSLREQLERTLRTYSARCDITIRVLACDFIEDAVNTLQFRPRERFTHAILNPPYRKIDSRSRHRLLLRQIGIETVNLYSAFVALSVALLEGRGQVVAIVPRSFCNGPYYRPFRDFILDRAAIRHIHLFASRDRAFKDDDVLQENVIVLLERDAEQGDVRISTSTDDEFSDYVVHDHPFDQIVAPNDPDRFIRVPTSSELSVIDLMPVFRYSLADIGIEVSTGPVVDFRVKQHLRGMPEAGCVPLLYPHHFVGQSVQWPRRGSKKPNALMLNTHTEKWVYPSGFYTVVRRFSSKEERRRIVASVVSPSAIEAPFLGFENHLNVFHRAKHALPEELARGLALYLNSTAIDDFFRRFSGHTQVNATDLRRMRYPSREVLSELGRFAMNQQSVLTQEQIDRKVESIR